MKPDLPKWAKWIIGGSIVAHESKNLYDQYKDVEDYASQFKDNSNNVSTSR
jgi:hypothetical protein